MLRKIKNLIKRNNTYHKLSDDVINQIKDFEHPYEEQESLIDELIPNEELRERYKKHGLCNECSCCSPNLTMSQVKLGISQIGIPISDFPN